MLAAIMVHVDFDDDTKNRIDIAADLAKRFNSVLIGVAGWPLRDMVKHSNVEYPPVEETRHKQILKELEKLGESFRQRAGSNPRGVEWRSSAHFPREVIAGEACAADLIIIGREPLPGDRYHTFDPGTIIMTAGRPVMVVARGASQRQLSRILVAWKNSREARRAVRDALPLLKEAQSVVVAAVGPEGIEERLSEQVAELAKYLARHRISVTEHVATAAGEAEGNVLLRAAKEQNADLIVAGAYGRSRLSEWAFGGMTQHLLHKSTVPCFFAN